jgi:hypothetical protein
MDTVCAEPMANTCHLQVAADGAYHVFVDDGHRMMPCGSMGTDIATVALCYHPDRDQSGRRVFLTGGDLWLPTDTPIISDDPERQGFVIGRYWIPTRGVDPWVLSMVHADGRIMASTQIDASPCRRHVESQVYDWWEQMPTFPGTMPQVVPKESGTWTTWDAMEWIYACLDTASRSAKPLSTFARSMQMIHGTDPIIDQVAHPAPVEATSIMTSFDTPWLMTCMQDKKPVWCAMAVDTHDDHRSVADVRTQQITDMATVMFGDSRAIDGLTIRVIPSSDGKVRTVGTCPVAQR